jgi:hypothetical protein
MSFEEQGVKPLRTDILAASFTQEFNTKQVDTRLLKMLRQAQHEDPCGLHPELVEGLRLIFLCPQSYNSTLSYTFT